MQQSNRFTCSKLAVAIFAAGMAGSATAQMLEEIVVTAQQRAQSL